MEIIFQPESWIALLTLTFLEIVLGIDNIIFISIVSNKLPENEQPRARLIGLTLALGVRILMLASITYIIGFVEPLFSILGHDISGRDLILAIGGLFLLAKSTTEIHHKIEGKEEEEEKTMTKARSAFGKIIVQIILLDIIFSFDSILTAVGMSRELPIMITAVIISIIVMMIFSGAISKFINNHPTLQILALSFLILIGFMLMIESMHFHVPKGYIYFAVFFSLSVEVLNIRMRRHEVRK